MPKRDSKKRGHVEERPLPEQCLRRKCGGGKRSVASCRFSGCNITPVRERFEREIPGKEAGDE